ncbi:hypothetical protein CASFOL_010395 [Castilleja foliolosa]|uniref:NAC domain-containing protein n=1 Tax=Castilleja foliolosa TaxID=1961234 RepID=A0ABD3DSL1_9LAMI
MNNTLTRVPPGFRFHPTDEELVDYYLRRKVNNRRIDLDVIKDVDLYKIEPWDLQELCFWKATGRDKAIYSKNELVGMRKTLVFYQGRAPNGQKSDWIMHEYRLETDENGPTQEEGWAVCRVFKKKMVATRKPGERGSPVWYDDQVSFMHDMDSPRHHLHHHQHHNPNDNLHYQYPNFSKKMDLEYPITSDQHFLQLPNLESPKLMQPLNMHSGLSQEIHQTDGDHSLQSMFVNNFEQCGDQMTDWRVMDKFVASQLSQDDIILKGCDTFDHATDNIETSLDKQELMAGMENASSCQIDLWE